MGQCILHLMGQTKTQHNNNLPRSNNWVFSDSKEGRITEPRSAHVRALQMAGLPHISIHGPRPIDLLRAWHIKIEAWMSNEAGIEYIQHNSLQLVA